MYVSYAVIVSNTLSLSFPGFQACNFTFWFLDCSKASSAESDPAFGGTGERRISDSWIVTSESLPIKIIKSNLDPKLWRGLWSLREALVVTKHPFLMRNPTKRYFWIHKSWYTKPKVSNMKLETNGLMKRNPHFQEVSFARLPLAITSGELFIDGEPSWSQEI